MPNMRRKTECRLCKKVFRPKLKNGIYCSVSCRAKSVSRGRRSENPYNIAAAGKDIKLYEHLVEHGKIVEFMPPRQFGPEPYLMENQIVSDGCVWTTFGDDCE